MDSIKKYLQEKGSALDNSEFDTDANWQEVKAKLRQKKSRLIVLRWSVAASFLLLATSSVFIMLNQDKQLSTVAQNEDKIKANNKRDSQIILIDSQPQIVNVQPEKNKKTATKITAAPVVTAKNKKPKPLTALDEMNHGFETVINTQLKTIRATAFYAANENYFSVFKKQLTNLDQLEKEAKAELANAGPANADLGKLINIYQLKIQLLKQLQFEIDKMNNRVKKSTGDTLSNKSFVNI